MPEGQNHDIDRSHSKIWSKTSICEIGNLHLNIGIFNKFKQLIRKFSFKLTKILLNFFALIKIL